MAGFDFALAREAREHEAELGYYFADGRYWRHFEAMDAQALAELDQRWLLAAGQ